MGPEAGANTIFIEKRRVFSVKKVSALYIKTRRWYDLKLDARGNALLINRRDKFRRAVMNYSGKLWVRS